MDASTELTRLLAGPPDRVAPRLLGAVLRHGEVALRLTELEAYAGEQDPGSHGFRGPTRRNRTMFGPPGHLYCYFSYGMHVCANVVVGESGHSAGLLLRAGAVIDGLDVARSRRPDTPDHRLARGPALLTRTLGIRLDDDGSSLAGPDFTLTPQPPLPASAIACGPRVGLRSAADRPWRFWVQGDPTVSAYRRHAQAGPPAHPL